MKLLTIVCVFATLPMPNFFARSEASVINATDDDNFAARIEHMEKDQGLMIGYLTELVHSNSVEQRRQKVLEKEMKLMLDYIMRIKNTTTKLQSHVDKYDEDLKQHKLKDGCCWRIKVDYASGSEHELAHNDSVSKQYYGYYKMETGLINGRNHWTSEFDNGYYGIWWSTVDSWQIGISSDRGKNACQMYSSVDEQCVHDVLWDWNFFDSSNGDNSLAAGKSLSVWCQRGLNPELFTGMQKSINEVAKLQSHVEDLKQHKLKDGCCWRVRVDYASGNENKLAHKDQKSKYGYYRMEDGLINGRNHWTSEFDDGEYSIWWATNDNWIVGYSSDRGQAKGHIHTTVDRQCPDDVLWDWTFFDSSSTMVAAEKSASVWCQKSLDPELFNHVQKSINVVEKLHNYNMNQTQEQGTCSCSRVEVDRNLDADNQKAYDKHSFTFGFYKMEYGLINGRNHWISEFKNGKYAIWWDSTNNCWTIGNTSERGGTRGYIIAHKDYKCVQQVAYDWKYYDAGDDEWHAAERGLRVWCR